MQGLPDSSVGALLRGWLRRGFWALGTLYICVAPGCGEELPKPKGEFEQNIRPWVRKHVWAGGTMEMRAEQLGFRGLGNAQRAVWEALEVNVVSDSGVMMLHLEAKMALALHPYEELTVQNLTLTDGDETTFSAGEMTWPHMRNAKELSLNGEVTLQRDDFLILGEDVVGDVLLRGYKIAQVHSAMELPGKSSSDSANAIQRDIP